MTCVISYEESAWRGLEHGRVREIVIEIERWMKVLDELEVGASAVTGMATVTAAVIVGSTVEETVAGLVVVGGLLVCVVTVFVHVLAFVLFSACAQFSVYVVVHSTLLLLLLLFSSVYHTHNYIVVVVVVYVLYM